MYVTVSLAELCWYWKSCTVARKTALVKNKFPGTFHSGYSNSGAAAICYAAIAAHLQYSSFPHKRDWIVPLSHHPYRDDIPRSLA